MRDGAEELARHPDRITDAELDAIGNVFARGLYGMDRAFSVGKIAVVDSVCREAMGNAYNESSCSSVQSLRSRHTDITPANAPQLFPVFLDDFRSAAKQLNVAVADLVEVSQGRISPTQSLAELLAAMWCQETTSTARRGAWAGAGAITRTLTRRPPPGRGYPTGSADAGLGHLASGRRVCGARSRSWRCRRRPARAPRCSGCR